VVTEFTSLALAFGWSVKIGYSIFNKKFMGIVTKVIIARRRIDGHLP